MIDNNLRQFLRLAQSDPTLAREMNSIDGYAEMEALAERRGARVPAEQFRLAFCSRNAGVLVRQMMQRGILGCADLAPVPPMDMNLWDKAVAMDLEPVTMQLVNYHEYSDARARSAERRYRRFFFLKALFASHSASPSDEVDEFWHQHIINTAKYAKDCHAVAGCFLHHDFLSPEEPVDARMLETLRLETWVAYETLFGEPYEETLGAAFQIRWPKV
jgi:hypothetical protein